MLWFLFYHLECTQWVVSSMLLILSIHIFYVWNEQMKCLLCMLREWESQTLFLCEFLYVHHKILVYICMYVVCVTILCTTRKLKLNLLEITPFYHTFRLVAMLKLDGWEAVEFFCSFVIKQNSQSNRQCWSSFRVVCLQEFFKRYRKWSSKNNFQIATVCIINLCFCLIEKSFRFCSETVHTCWLIFLALFSFVCIHVDNLIRNVQNDEVLLWQKSTMRERLFDAQNYPPQNPYIYSNPYHIGYE